jgi:peptidyl-tRNA hydrolase
LDSGSLYHYVIVRADLPRGLQSAQIVHAAGESAANRPVPEHTHAVVLQVDDEEHLLYIAEKLHYACVPYNLIIENSLPTDERSPLEDGQGTAIGIPLVSAEERKRVTAIVGRLPLLR